MTGAASRLGVGLLLCLSAFCRSASGGSFSTRFNRTRNDEERTFDPRKSEVQYSRYRDGKDIDWELPGRKSTSESTLPGLRAENNLDMLPDNSHETNKTVVNKVLIYSPFNHWKRLKIILSNMESVIKDLYLEDARDVQNIQRFFRFAHLITDKMVLLESVKAELDKELTEFLTAQFSDLLNLVLKLHPLLESLSGWTLKPDWQDTVEGALKMTGRLLKSRASTHISELRFISDLMKSSGFSKEEVDKVFLLLDFPVDSEGLKVSRSEVAPRKRRQANYYNYDYPYEKAGGHSGYGQMPAYAQVHTMQSLDPFVLLAGLAFATFLAYIVYRLLTTTAAGRRKRSMDSLTISLELSDTPSVMSNMEDWIQKSRIRFEDVGDEFNVVDLAEDANSLWRTYGLYSSSDFCIKKSLCRRTTNHSSYRNGGSYARLGKHLILTSLANLLGELSSGMLIDLIYSEYSRGVEPQCQALVPDCSGTEKRLQ